MKEEIIVKSHLGELKGLTIAFFNIVIMAAAETSSSSFHIQSG